MYSPTVRGVLECVLYKIVIFPIMEIYDINPSKVLSFSYLWTLVAHIDLATSPLKGSKIGWPVHMKFQKCGLISN